MGAPPNDSKRLLQRTGLAAVELFESNKRSLTSSHSMLFVVECGWETSSEFLAGAARLADANDSFFSNGVSDMLSELQYLS